MSPQGRRSMADYLLLLKVAVAAVFGGLCAMALLAFDGRLRTGLLLAVVLAVALLLVLAVATLQSDHHESAEVREPMPPSGRGGGYRPQRGPLPRAMASPPVPRPDPSRTEWFDKTERGAARGDAWTRDTVAPTAAVPPPGRPSRPGEVRSPTYARHAVPGASVRNGRPVRRIVQCPRCGDFDVDLRPDGGSFSFACLRCNHRWTWAPGEPWPATVVRPAAPVRDTGTA